MCCSILIIADAAALRQDNRGATPNVYEGLQGTSKNYPDRGQRIENARTGVNVTLQIDQAKRALKMGDLASLRNVSKMRANGKAELAELVERANTLLEKYKAEGTMDLVMVHCNEEFDIVNGGNGLNQGFSPVLWDAGNRDGLLRLRRRIIYTKCRAPLRVGPAVKIVNMSYESYQIGASFEREESAYIKYIVDHYWDLADWTVFVHGFPEEHNRHLFAWLDSFKRPKPTSPVFIPLNSKYVLYRPILKSFLLRIGLGKEVKLAAQLNPSEENSDVVQTVAHCCSQFVVSSQAIKLRPLTYWQNVQNLFRHQAFRSLVEQTATIMARDEKSAVGVRRTDTTVTDATDVRSAAFGAEPWTESGGSDFSTKVPSSGDVMRETRREYAERLALMSSGTVDLEGSKTYEAFESVWHILFGHPVRDQDMLQNNSASRAYYCEWFNDQTNSPCKMRNLIGKWDRCWMMRSFGKQQCSRQTSVAHGLEHHKQSGAGFPYSMEKEELLSGTFCCGTGAS